MSTIDILRREVQRLPASPLKRINRWLQRRLPKGLYARSLLIIIVPMVLLQSVIAFVFMERHWQTVTQRLSTAVTRDIAAIVDVIETYPQTADYGEVVRIARDRLSLNIAIEPPEPLPPAGRRPFFSILDRILTEELTEQIRRPFWIDTVGDSGVVEIRINLGDKNLRVFAPRNQAYASNTHIFLLWMVGTSLVLLAIAIPFLRNQIKPILALASAAESFGRGQPTPSDFRPRGADEVRRAGMAFLRMRERIERQIEQRTAMLTGVSHDLRTILTRFKLQLALAGDDTDKESLNRDIEDMQSMLAAYLAFARGETEEEFGDLDLRQVLDPLKNDAELRDKIFNVEMTGSPLVKVRPTAFTRLIGNLVSNAFRHADRIELSATQTKNWLLIEIEDNGPGIPEDERDEVFKPFYRLDEARNLDETSTGLGLSIARDIARSHGGEVILDNSPMGGLRATIRVPV